MAEFDHLIQEQIPRLRRYARALLRDRYRADDLVQDTLERAWGRFDLWRRNSDLRAWMFTIMHNLFVNQGKSAHAEQAGLMQENGEWEIPVRATQEDGLAVQDLHAAISRLPPQYREVVLLVGLEQMKYEEVARVLEIPLGTVMSRLARGREQLRDLLAGNPLSPHLRRVK